MLNQEKKYKTIILPIVLKYLPNAKIYLFGSRARKDAKEGSDVDIGLDVGKKIDLNIILDIKAEIEETTMPLFIDIVDIHSISDDLKEEIFKDGIPWKD